MRGDVVYRIYGRHEGREKDTFFGAFRNVAEAEAMAAELSTKEMNGRNWAQQYHNLGFEVRESIVDADFEIPSLPKPRDKYFVRGKPKPNRPGTWDSTIVEVFRRGDSGTAPVKICEYERFHSLFQTFGPFRQGDRDFALISSDYTRTSVLDLQSGRIAAEEPDPGSMGFCPVGFYVPDWWDVNDDSIIPGSEYWNEKCEWPTGAFGFVWGCIWGDDGSWKVQHLDLTQVQQGMVRRDDRFGYVELATIGFTGPCFQPEVDLSRRRSPPPFIDLSNWRVTFTVEMQFGLESGKPADWQRLKITNLE